MSYTAMLLVSMIFAGLGHMKLYQTARLHAEEQAIDRLRQAAYIADGYVDTIRQSMLSLCLNKSVNSFVYTHLPFDAEDYYRITNVMQEVATSHSANSYLEMLFVYFSQQDSVISAVNRMSTVDFYDTYLDFEEVDFDRWEAMLNHAAGFGSGPVQTQSRSRERFIPFTISMPLAVSSRGAVVGYLNAECLEALFLSSGLIDDGSVYIEEEEQVVCTWGQDRPIEMDRTGDTNAAWQKNEEGRFLVVSIQGSGNWRYSCVLPASNLLEEVESTRVFIIGMLLMELLGGVLLAMALVRTNYNPLRVLINHLTDHEGEASNDINEYERILNATNRIISENTNLVNRLHRQQPMVRASLLHQLLENKSTMDRRILMEYGIKLPNPYCVVLLIYIHGGCKEENYAIRNYSFISIAEEWFSKYVPCFALEQSTDTIAFLLNVCQQDISRLVNEMIVNVCNELLFMPIIGMGRTVTSVNEVHHSYMQAQEALHYAVAWHKEGITRYDEVNGTTERYVYSQNREQELMLCLREGNGACARQSVRNLFAEVHEVPLVRIKTMAFGVVTTCMRMLAEWKIAAPEIMDESLLGVHIMQMASPERLCEELCVLVEQVAKTANEIKKGGFSAVGKEMMQIIQENYGDNTLSLTMIADKLGFNASYLSYLFKQQTGEGFIEVLTRVRIEQALKLLSSTSMTIQAIAEKCGYTSAGYFTRIFKNQYGKTPGQYREALQREGKRLSEES